MKWFLVLLVLVGGFAAYKYFGKSDPNALPDSPMGAMNAFVGAAVAGDYGRVEALSLSAEKAQLVASAKQMNEIIPPGLGFQWQAAKPSKGTKAFQAQVTGKSKMLVMELDEENGRPVVCLAQLADF